jgi:GTPase-activating protein SST2
MRNWVEDFDPTEEDVRLLAAGNPSQPPGLGEETGGAYITISQQGSERAQHPPSQSTTSVAST